MQNGSVRIGRTEVCFYENVKLIMIIIYKSFVDHVTSNLIITIVYFSG